MSERKAKVVTFAADKGGVGKSTFLFHGGHFMAEKGNKVLEIDFDYQGSLTLNYHPTEEEKEEHNLYKIFPAAANTKQHPLPDIKPLRVAEYDNGGCVDLFTAERALEDVGSLLTNIMFKSFILDQYLYENKYYDSYDYILIDTHPGFDLATENGIAASDVLVSPIEPSSYGSAAIEAVQDKIEEIKNSNMDLRTHESYVNCEVRYVSDRLKKNTSLSHALENEVKENDLFIAYLHESEIINQANTAGVYAKTYALDEMKNHSLAKPRGQRFLDELDEQLTALKNGIDRVGE